jgi:hypothetical protein
MIENVLKIVFAPLISFLQKEGFWDSLVDVYNALKGPVGRFFEWVGSLGINWVAVWDVVLDIFKLLLRITVAVVHVLIDIVNWIVGLF